MVYLSTIGAQASQPNLLTRHTIIGKLAAALLQETVERHRVGELAGAHCVTPNEIAAGFTKVLGQSLQNANRAARSLGGTFQVARDEETRCLACRCWMALTKAGSGSRAAKPVREKALLCCAKP